MNDFLNGLNEQQLEAVTDESSSLLILAGAGSGKTRVITTKIAYLISEKNVDPRSILAVTFTKKAANEMRERACALDERAAYSEIRTFHSFGANFLRKFADYVPNLSPNFTVYDEDAMAVIIKEAKITFPVPVNKRDIKKIVKMISLAKDYCLGPEDSFSVLDDRFDKSIVNFPLIYKLYEKKLRATGNVDFGDLIMLPVKILEREQKVAEMMYEKYKVILVDEYQDSNTAQYRLLQSLSGVKNGNNCYVCVVGDDDQSIYHFRGAEVGNILTFPNKFKDTKIIRLERNYRSTEEILDLASSVVQENKDRLDKVLVSDKGKGAKPCLAFVNDSNQEVNLVADTISKDVQSGGKYSDWAILYRTNAQSLNFEKELLRRKMPYQIIGAMKFYEREEIKDIISYLNLVVNPRDMISFTRIVNKPARGIGRITLESIASKASYMSESGEFAYKNILDSVEPTVDKYKKTTAESIKYLIKIFKDFISYLSTPKNASESLSVFIKKVIEASGLEEYYKSQDEIEGTQKLENLQEFVNSAFSYSCSMSDLIEFMDSISLDRSLVTENGEIEEEPITLITIHNTKGLEYKKVIITGMEDGVFPRGNETPKELEEERRLFYVGITRAKEQLIITSAEKRVLYGYWEKRLPSRFLINILDKFHIVGRIPYEFILHIEATQPDNKKIPKVEPPKNNGNESVDRVYTKGTKVFDDDFGEGEIVNQSYIGNTLTVTVRFSNGVKLFNMSQALKKLLVIN